MKLVKLLVGVVIAIATFLGFRRFGGESKTPVANSNEDPLNALPDGRQPAPKPEVSENQPASPGSDFPAPVSAESESSEPAQAHFAPRSEKEAAAFDFLGELVANLDQPTDFATLSNLVKHRFGEEESSDWFGNGKFKTLLSRAVPEAKVVAKGSSYVLPPGMEASDFTAPIAKGRQIAPRVARIRQVDDNFPNLEASTWPILYRSLSLATQQLRWKGSATVKTVNACCAKARELTKDSAQVHLGRKEFNYVAWMLYTRGELRTNMSRLEVENCFVDALIRRCRAARLSSTDIQYTEAWVRGNPMENGRA